MEKQIRLLINELNEASKAYYGPGTEIMSNFEYDKKYDLLVQLEKESGIIFPDSPTQNVGAEVTGERKKVKHEYEAKSLDKTKDSEELKKWLSDRVGLLSLKLDGQTVVLTYENGKLVLAATRGNGEVGQDITDIAPYIEGIPAEISFKGKLVLRGESMMSYEEFERINKSIESEADKYKNPRNLAVGTMNILDIEEFKKRKLNFKAFYLVLAEGKELYSLSNCLSWLKTLGFDIVPMTMVPSTYENMLDGYLDMMTKFAARYEFPTDGLVLSYDDIEYGKSLGSTGHHARHSMAFKWKDESVETKLIDVEWSPSKTGLLNPVLIFEPVEIEGTTVSRASIHNVSIFKNLMLGKGDSLMIYKANQIIPQCESNLTKSNTLDVPTTCPVCGGLTKIKTNVNPSGEKIMTLYCTNPDCSCKTTGKLEYFVTRNAMDIEGISEKTITALYEKGWLTKPSDFYSLHEYVEEMMEMNGMGKTAVQNMISAIEKSKTTDLARFINALSIPLVGKDMAKLISDYCEETPSNFKKVLENPETLTEISGIGEAIISSIQKWYENDSHKDEFEKLISILTFTKKEKAGASLNGMTFVITGSVNHFPNRDALKDFIISHGGKVAGSVSNKTNYLINNDVASTSGKNKKAKELGVSIIDEETFLSMIEQPIS